MIGALSFSYNFYEADIADFTLIVGEEEFQSSGVIKFLILLDELREKHKKLTIYVKDLNYFYLLTKRIIPYEDGKGYYDKDKGLKILHLSYNEDVELIDESPLLPPGGKINNPRYFLAYLKALHTLYGGTMGSYKWTLTRIVKGYLCRKYFFNSSSIKQWKKDCLPTEEEWNVYKNMERAGFYFTNPKFMNRIIENVYQRDASTNHAAIMARKFFPVYALRPISPEKFEEIRDDEKWSWMLTFSYKKVEEKIPFGISLRDLGARKDKETGRYYISIINPQASWFFKVFDFEDLKIERIMGAPAARLKNEALKAIRDFYSDKEAAKKPPYKGTIIEQISKFPTEILYGASIRNPEPFWETNFNSKTKTFYRIVNKQSFEETQKNLLKNIMPFQVGLWTLAYSNAQLINLILDIGIDNVVYADTDCVKFVGNEGLGCVWKHNNAIAAEFERVRQEKGIKFNSKLGRWKDEGLATKFKSIGIKWYITEVDGKFEAKAAGANKEKIDEFVKNSEDPINAFTKELEEYGVFDKIYFNEQKGWFEDKKRQDLYSLELTKFEN